MVRIRALAPPASPNAEMLCSPVLMTSDSYRDTARTPPSALPRILPSALQRSYTIGCTISGLLARCVSSSNSGNPRCALATISSANLVVSHERIVCGEPYTDAATSRALVLPRLDSHAMSRTNTGADTTRIKGEANATATTVAMSGCWSTMSRSTTSCLDASPLTVNEPTCLANSGLRFSNVGHPTPACFSPIKKLGAVQSVAPCQPVTLATISCAARTVEARYCVSALRRYNTTSLAHVESTGNPLLASATMPRAFSSVPRSTMTCCGLSNRPNSPARGVHHFTSIDRVPSTASTRTPATHNGCKLTSVGSFLLSAGNRTTAPLFVNS